MASWPNIFRSDAPVNDANAPLNSRQGWLARLGLAYQPRTRPQCRTVVQRTEQLGPLTVQKPFYPEGDLCHTYVLHPPGGIVGGDSVELTASVAPGAAALLTTPAATKVYRSAGPESVVTQSFKVSAGGSLEWLPADTILFGSSRHCMETQVDLATGASYCGWEVISLGRPASGDPYASGEMNARLKITVGGYPLLIEAQSWDSAAAADWQLGGARAYGTMQLFPADTDLLEKSRADLPVGYAVTLLDELLLVRALDADPVRLRAVFVDVWSRCRPLHLQRAACQPRIWST